MLKQLMLLIAVVQVYRGKKPQFDRKRCNLNTNYKYANTECVFVWQTAQGKQKSALDFLIFIAVCTFFLGNSRKSWKCESTFFQCPSGTSLHCHDIFFQIKILPTTRKINIYYIFKNHFY